MTWQEAIEQAQELDLSPKDRKQYAYDYLRKLAVKEEQTMSVNRNVRNYQEEREEEILCAMFESKRTPYSQMFQRTEGKIIVMPEVKKIIHSGPVTVVFWKDGTKTLVRCAAHDAYDEYNAFCAALAIKMYGNNSKLKKMIKKATVEK